MTRALWKGTVIAASDDGDVGGLLERLAACVSGAGRR